MSNDCVAKDSTGLCHHFGPCQFIDFGYINQSGVITDKCDCTNSKGCLDEVYGTKHDGDKLDITLVSNLLIEEISRVREFGQKKYSRENWRLGFKYNRSLAAALRHILAFKEGEDLDPESGLSHIAHAVCCLEHLMNDIKNHPNNDDRYKNK